MEVNLRCHDNVNLHLLSRKRVFLPPNSFLHRRMLQDNQQSVVYSSSVDDRFYGVKNAFSYRPISAANTWFFCFFFHRKSQEQPLSGTENSHFSFSTQQA